MSAPAESSAPDRRAGPRGLTRADGLIALALGVTFIAVLLSSVGTLGYARDEGFYFQASSDYARWFQQLWADPGAALTRRGVDAAWSSNHEHPALIKSLFALSNLLLQKRLHLFSMEGTSYRFPAMLLGGGLIALVYLWGAEARGRAAGLAAAIALAAMPRFFFHAHLACFDVPIVAIWTLCAYAFWRALRTQGWRWPLLTGLTFGLALDTKHNSWFLPFVFGAHAAATLLARRALFTPAERASSSDPARRALLALAAMAVIGPVVFIGLWPWIWHDTVARLRDYARFHLEHEYYNMEYLGVTYFTPPMPRTYAFVMTAATVPLVTLLLAAAGLLGRVILRVREGASRLLVATSIERRAPRVAAALRRVARRAGSALSRRGPTADTELLWLLSIGAIYAAWLSPRTPIFGGTKHWMTAYPFLALFAGTGFHDVVLAVRAQLLRLRSRIAVPRGLRAGPALAALLGACALASPIVQTARSHPWGLSSYTPLVGGASGAATLGLNRTFWGYTTGAVAPYLNGAPRGAAVYLHDTAYQSWEMLLADGRVRRDLRGAWQIDPSDVALYHHEMHMQGVEHQIWIAYGTARPDEIAGLDGVPVIWVYRRPPRGAVQRR